MKKPTLADALAKKAPKPPPLPPAQALPIKVKREDNRTTTTIRIDPDLLEALKILAAKRRMKVNDLLLEGVKYVLESNGQTVD